MAQFKRRRGTKEGEQYCLRRQARRGAAARVQGTVGSQSVNLTLNVNVSGGRSPGTPPRRADATDGTDGGKHGNNTNNAAPRTVDWFDSNCCPLYLSASLRAPYHTVLPSKKK